MATHVLQESNTSFSEQVDMYKKSGIVVGIHGANLVNVMFMHAFSALVELANDNTVCYIRGMNSGLAYWHYVPRRVATVEEWLRSKTVAVD